MDELYTMVKLASCEPFNCIAVDKQVNSAPDYGNQKYSSI